MNLTNLIEELEENIKGLDRLNSWADTMMCDDVPHLLAALKEAKSIIELNYKHFVGRVPEHREYASVDLNGTWLDKWFKEGEH